jgi:hypothetical protein
MQHFNTFHIPSRKIKNSFHHSQTSTKTQQKERKMKRDEEKGKKKKEGLV